MKFKKLILPMLAFICAIGVAFATVDLNPEPKVVTDDSYATMYIRANNAWHAVEVECGDDQFDCKAFFTEDPSGTIYQVYNSQSLSDLAKGTGDLKPIEGPPPSN